MSTTEQKPSVIVYHVPSQGWRYRLVTASGALATPSAPYPTVVQAIVAALLRYEGVGVAVTDYGALYYLTEDERTAWWDAVEIAVELGVDHRLDCRAAIHELVQAGELAVPDAYEEAQERAEG